MGVFRWRLRLLPPLGPVGRLNTITKGGHSGLQSTILVLTTGGRILTRSSAVHIFWIASVAAGA